jgi:MraZ protein
MFRGTFKHTVDDKGRLSIPAKYREMLEQRHELPLYVTLQEGHLVAFPADEWRVLEAKFNSVSLFDNRLRDLQRHIFAKAEECTLDKAGRILIPPTLREKAGLERNVLICGMMTSFEIWNPERYELAYENFLSNPQESFEAAQKHGI